MITLPTTAPTDVFAATGAIFSDIWLLIAFAVGLPLTFYLIGVIIDVIAPPSPDEGNAVEKK